MQQLFNATKAAQYLGIDRSSFYRLFVAVDTFPHVSLNGRKMYNRSDLDGWISKNTVKEAGTKKEKDQPLPAVEKKVKAAGKVKRKAK